MYLPLGYGEITDNTLTESLSEVVPVSIPIQWALNTQGFTLTRGTKTSSIFNGPLGTGATGNDPGGSTTFRACFEHLGTSAQTEVGNVWAWNYVRTIYPERCSFVPDDAFYVGTLTPSVYVGASTGCPAIGDFTDAGSPVSDNIVFDPIYNFVTVDAVLENFGYLATGLRDPTSNLRVRSIITEASAGCVNTGSQWASNGETTASWELAQITFEAGEISSLDASGVDVIASATTSQTNTITRIGFSDWTWDRNVYRAALALLGI